MRNGVGEDQLQTREHFKETVPFLGGTLEAHIARSDCCISREMDQDGIWRDSNGEVMTETTARNVYQLSPQQALWLMDNPVFVIGKPTHEDWANKRVSEWGTLDNTGEYSCMAAAWNGDTGNDSSTGEIYVYQIRA